MFIETLGPGGNSVQNGRWSFLVRLCQTSIQNYYSIDLLMYALCTPKLQTHFVADLHNTMQIFLKFFQGYLMFL